MRALLARILALGTGLLILALAIAFAAIQNG